MSIQTEQADDSVEALLCQVADEFTQRLNRGERASIEEYVEKHPEVAEQLRGVLMVVLQMRGSDVAPVLPDDDRYLRDQPLSDFRLLRKIGEGGMGIVYEAQQLSQGNRTVAVKILPYVAALDSRRLQRFKIEAETASKLNHEHIVPVYVVGCERGVHYYAMQYIDGLSLADIIKKLRQFAGLEPADQPPTVPWFSPAGAPPAAGTDPSQSAVRATEGSPDVKSDPTRLAMLMSEGSLHSPEYYNTVARLGLEAAKGLEHVHQHQTGVWHRDIKPANLLVDRLANLWITDFGLAQIRSDPRLSLTGELVGTLRYMSPEQILAKRVPIDQRTDIYSLGATLYELLTLNPVFGGNGPELLRQIVFDDPQPPRRLDRHVPRDLETIVLRALAKAPAHRYATAKEMGEELQRVLNEETIRTRPESLPRWLWRMSRRHAGSIALGLAAVLSSVFLMLFLLSVNKPSPDQQNHERQQRALTVLTQDLDRNRKVTLIGESGPPGYFDVKTNKTVTKIVEASDGAFSVQNWEYGLVELLPDPHLERYRFSAEVRHERQADQESRVGIYFAHSQHEDGNTVAHFHCNIAFNDLVDVGAVNANGNHEGNSVGLQAHRQLPTGLAPHKADIVKPDIFFRPAKPVGALGPWRKLAVEVRPETIKVFWDEQSSTIPRATLMKNARILSAKRDEPLPNNHPQFAPRDGLGLYASLGVASFRNVIVEPLGDEN
jgi:serine/threonine protein kinase